MKNYAPDLALDGVLVEKMGKRGLELIIGARSDPDWGPVILAGFGGVQAEILKDARLLPPDLPKDAIIRELNLLKMSPLLRGFRGFACARCRRRRGHHLKARSTAFGRTVDQGSRP